MCVQTGKTPRRRSFEDCSNHVIIVLCTFRSLKTPVINRERPFKTEHAINQCFDHHWAKRKKEKKVPVLRFLFVASSRGRLSSVSEPFHSAAPTVSSMYRKLLKRVHKVLLRSRSSLWYSPATYGTPRAFLFTVRSHKVIQSSVSGFTYCFDCACII